MGSTTCTMGLHAGAHVNFHCGFNEHTWGKQQGWGGSYGSRICEGNGEQRTPFLWALKGLVIHMDFPCTHGENGMDWNEICACHPCCNCHANWCKLKVWVHSELFRAPPRSDELFSSAERSHSHSRPSDCCLTLKNLIGFPPGFGIAWYPHGLVALSRFPRIKGYLVPLGIIGLPGTLPTKCKPLADSFHQPIIWKVWLHRKFHLMKVCELCPLLIAYRNLCRSFANAW